MCACLCTLQPARLEQLVCKSQSGGEDTVAARPKYFAAWLGAKVYRAIGNSSKVFQSFLFFFFFYSLVLVEPYEFWDLIQGLYHPVSGENEIGSTILEYIVCIGVWFV